MQQNLQKSNYYSVSWAYSVVNDIKRTYPRATEIVYHLLELSGKKHALLLANKDTLFVSIRTMIQRTNKLLRLHGKEIDTTQIASSLLDYCKQNHLVEYDYTLTEYLHGATIKSRF